MNIHEYQAKAVLREFGIPTARGMPAFSPEEAVSAAKEMGGDVWVDSKLGIGSAFGFHLTMTAIDDVEPDDITAPAWLDRAIVIDRDGMNRSVLLKQLGLMGLNATTGDSLTWTPTAIPRMSFETSIRSRMSPPTSSAGIDWAAMS